MKISVNQLRFINRHYQSAGEPAPAGVPALVEKIGSQLGGVDEVVPFGERYQGVMIAKVVSCEDHPDADRLRVCSIDDAGAVPDVERDENGFVQVVCGAPNVRAGLLVAWLPPGTIVPGTAGTDNETLLEVRDIRGVRSNGMLASAQELAISDAHDGILEITQDSDEQVRPGTSFAEAYHLKGDMVIDIENKMFTHRPDCFGYLGVAREIEGISHRPYKSPAWYRHDADFPEIEVDPLPLTVKNELPELVPRFVAIALRDVQVKPSPLWLQLDLARNGLRPINNIVDYTNFFMLETGQPLHAYDYDKVKALSGADHAALHIRHPHADESLTLLNGKTVQPRAEAILIATDKQAIGIGGVMGGAATEVDAGTKNIIIECANFDMYSIRRTAMEHGLFTDAVTRFTKGQSPLQNRAVAAKIVDEIRRFAGGKVASEVIDDIHLLGDVLQRGSLHPPVTVARSFITDRLGLDMSAEDMAILLRNVEFEVYVEDDELTVSAPFWRTDIEIPEDIVEEIGRLYGYDRLPLDLPKRAINPAPENQLFNFKSTLRDLLARAGANELLTYSFVRSDLLEKVNEDPQQSYKIRNALSPDLQYYRLSLSQSLLEKIHPNIKQGYRELALFEINSVPEPRGANELPNEYAKLALVFAADAKAAVNRPGAAFYQATYFLGYLAARLGIALSYERLDTSDIATGPFEPQRSAVVTCNGARLGIVGEYTHTVRQAFKLPECVAGFELDIALLADCRPAAASRYTPLSQFPATEQDVTFAIDQSTAYRELQNHIEGTLRGSDEALHVALQSLDIYQAADQPAQRRVSFRIQFRHDRRTLTTHEVNTLLDKAAKTAAASLGATRI